MTQQKNNPVKPGSKRGKAYSHSFPDGGSAVKENVPGRAPEFLGDKVLALRNAEVDELKYVTVLVADVPDTSSLSTKLAPEEAYSVMAHCLAILEEQIRHYGGTVAQVIGGVVKGLFGAPVSHEDHAKRACDAALSILKKLDLSRQKLREEFDADFHMRIGLVSGAILTSSSRGAPGLEYEDLEDVDDLISPLQAITRPGKTIVAKSTYDLASDFFEFRPVETNKPKGLKPVDAYELVKPRELASPIRARELKGLSKFVGREQEMSALMEAAEKARQGHGQALVITGDAGVGKSRLVFELKRRLPEDEQIFLEGHCRNYDGVAPYGPILDMLRWIFDIQAGEKDSSAEKKIQRWLASVKADVEEIVAPLHEILALKVEDKRYLGLAFQQKRNRIFQAVEQVLIHASREKPLVAIIEDLHWIDRSSEEVLNHLVVSIESVGILLVLLYRPEYSGVSRLGASTREVHLEHISGKYVRELLESVLGGPGIDDGLMNLVLDKTGGNPLLVEEFTHSLSDVRAIQRSNGKFILAPGVSTQVLPKTVQAVIAARMDRLDKDVKATLQAASVIGSEFPSALLQRVTATGDELESRISRLQDLEFIREVSASPERQFAFKHALTQEAAYGSLTARRKLKIHQKTGEAIEELYSDRLGDFYEQLAHHFGKSDDLQKQFKYLKLAAINASRRNSPWEAYQFGTGALRCLKSQPETQQNKKEKIEVLKMMGWHMRMLDYTGESTEHFLKRGEELCLEIGDANNLSFFRAELCVYYAVTGDSMSLQQYSGYVFQDIRVLGCALSTKEHLKIMIRLFVDHSLIGLMGDRVSEVLSVNLGVLKYMEQAHALFDAFDTPFNPYSFLAAMSAYFLSWLGDFDNAERLCRKALDVALEANDPISIGCAEFSYGLVLDNRGSGEEAIEHCTRAIEHLEKVKRGSASDTGMGNAWLGLGVAKFLMGDADGASGCIDRSIQMHLDGGFVLQFAHDYAYLSMAYLAAGEVAKARSCIDTALDWSRKCNQKHWEGLAKIFFGKILIESEILHAAEAEASILDGIQILSKLGMRPYCAQGYFYLGELQISTGRAQLGAKSLKKAERMFREMGMDYWLHKTQELLRSQISG